MSGPCSNAVNSLLSLSAKTKKICSEVFRNCQADVSSDREVQFKPRCVRGCSLTHTTRRRILAKFLLQMVITDLERRFLQGYWPSELGVNWLLSWTGDRLTLENPSKIRMFCHHSKRLSVTSGSHRIYAALGKGNWMITFMLISPNIPFQILSRVPGWELGAI